MSLNLISVLFSKRAGIVPPVVIGEALQKKAEAQVVSYGGRYYHTVTLSKEQSFAGLEETFKDIGFVPKPRIKVGDAFIGSGYVSYEEDRTAKILAKKDVAHALREKGYVVSLIVPEIQPAKYRL